MGEEVDILGGLAPFYPDGVSVGDIDKVKALSMLILLLSNDAWKPLRMFRVGK